MRNTTASILVLSLLAACAPVDEPAPTLYERLGEKAAITAVVDQFVANIAADTSINHHFAETDIPKLKSLLVEQICDATGGPCTYSGRDMVAAHKGMNITKDEFNKTGAHLAAALDSFNVPDAEKKELLTAIGSMAPDIIGQ